MERCSRLRCQRTANMVCLIRHLSCTGVGFGEASVGRNANVPGPGRIFTLAGLGKGSISEAGRGTRTAGRFRASGSISGYCLGTGLELTAPILLNLKEGPCKACTSASGADSCILQHQPAASNSRCRGLVGACVFACVDKYVFACVCMFVCACV